MNYLISYLEGETEASINRLKLFHNYYEVAKDLFKEQFGDKQTFILFVTRTNNFL